MDESIEVPRVPVEELPADEFNARYFRKAKPVIITGLASKWTCCKEWTIEGLAERLGSNEVVIRGKTSKADYRQGRNYTIRTDTFGSYCTDLVTGNARARDSYLAVASIKKAFPQLLPEVELPSDYVKKLHLGPYLWVAPSGHYEFTHFDPDDNFLVVIQGRKRVRMFGHEVPLESMYPNPLGSLGKTVQSQVDLDRIDSTAKFPLFLNHSGSGMAPVSRCRQCTLMPGEMLFIPAFYWHQVSALDNGISLNAFFGDQGDNAYLDKVLRPPYFEHFKYWLLNIVEQNRDCGSFLRMLGRLDEVLAHFFHKQWHETATPENLEVCVRFIKEHCGLPPDAPLPRVPGDASKFPPALKIRGLTNRPSKDPS